MLTFCYISISEHQMKSIAKKVPAQPFPSNTDTKQTYRVIGTTDINGKGTWH